MTESNGDDRFWEEIERERLKIDEARRTNQKRRVLRIGWVVVIVLVIYVLGSFLPIAIVALNERFVSEPLTTWETVAHAGDAFGAANALVSTVALLAAIYALILQTRELENLFVENWAQALELRIGATSQKDTAKSHRAALSAEVILPLVDEITETSEARRFVAFFMRKHLTRCLPENTPLEEYRARFQRRDVDVGDAIWVEAVKSARAELRDLRDGAIPNVSVETFDVPMGYAEVQANISKCQRTAHKIHGLWKAGVIESDRESIELAKIVLTPDVVALLEFQYRPLAEEQRSERSGDKDLPAVDFSLALYSEGGLELLREKEGFTQVSDEIYRNSRV